MIMSYFFNSTVQNEGEFTTHPISLEINISSLNKKFSI